MYLHSNKMIQIQNHIEKSLKLGETSELYFFSLNNHFHFREFTSLLNYD